jgi:hypothetical protein
MLQMFHLDILKVDLDIAHVAMAIGELEQIDWGCPT